MTAHTEKEKAAPNFKCGFGFHPLLAFVDHGPDGTGEPLSFLLRPGNAGSNTAADHITVTRQALSNMWKSPHWSGWTGSTTDDSTSTAGMCLRPNSRRSTTVNTELREMRSSQISK